MAAKRVVRGQPVSRVKAELALKLRREMTPHERLLWQRLRAGRLEGLHVRRQQVIDGFVVDFYCHAAALVVEVDGAVHAERRGYDAERDKILSARDLAVIHVTNSEVERDMAGVLRRIARVANSRRSHASPDESNAPSHEM